jgi:gephyrin
MDCCKEPTTANESRKSKFDMIAVEEAIEIVLRQSTFSYQEESVSIMNSCGRIVSKQITASDPFPSFPASIMDGYAVHAPLESGIFPVQDRIWAGDEAIGNNDRSTFLKPGHVVYITTGAMIPSGANAVIKIEDTDTVNGKPNNNSSERRRRESNETEVKINVSCVEGTSIRQIGSDINVGEIILQKGQLIGSAEVGLLATTGVSNVMCYKKPVVGVLSTGNELVNAWETPVGSQIRDSNRASLISAFQSEGNNVIDLGILNLFYN